MKSLLCALIVNLASVKHHKIPLLYEKWGVRKYREISSCHYLFILKGRGVTFTSLNYGTVQRRDTCCKVEAQGWSDSLYNKQPNKAGNKKETSILCLIYMHLHWYFTLHEEAAIEANLFMVPIHCYLVCISELP